MSSTPIHLDGTTLEGGGQLLRLAISLSSLTHIAVHLTKIRGNRPGKNGGMKPSHLAAVRWLAQATAATTEGMEVKSKELIFRPSQTSHTVDNRKKSGMAVGVWNEIFEAGKLIRRESYIPMSTPGSITLVLQAILPYLLFSVSSDTTDRQNIVPLRITIDGGTNLSSSPSIEYVSQVLLPLLSQKVGLAPMTATLHCRGWSTGRSDVGSVTFEINPLPSASILPAFSFEKRGDLTKVHVSILVPEATAGNSIRDKVTAQLLAYNSEIEILFPVNENSGNDKRYYLLLVAETSSGYRLGRDWLFDEKTRGISTDQVCEKLVSKVVKNLKIELQHGGCVDEYMQDQLVVFQALTAGKTKIDGGGDREASLHTKTARWVVEKVLDVAFDDLGSCHGVGFSVGENFLRANMDQATIS